MVINKLGTLNSLIYYLQNREHHLNTNLIVIIFLYPREEYLIFVYTHYYLNQTQIRILNRDHLILSNKIQYLTRLKFQPIFRYKDHLLRL